MRPAYGILAWKILARQCFIDQDYRRRFADIAAGKQPPAQQGDSHRIEIHRADTPEIGDQRLVGRKRTILDSEVLAVVLLPQREHVAQTGGLNTGDPVNPVEYAPVEVGLFAIGFVEIVGGEAHAKGEDMVGADAGVDVLQIHKALHGQSRTDKQHAGEGHFSGHQQTPHTRAAERCRRRTVCRFQAASFTSARAT